MPPRHASRLKYIWDIKKNYRKETEHEVKVEIEELVDLFSKVRFCHPPVDMQEHSCVCAPTCWMHAYCQEDYKNCAF